MIGMEQELDLMKQDLENTSSRNEVAKVEKSLEKLATRQQIYEIHEDMLTKIDKREMDVFLFEGEKNMALAAKLPTREEIIERLGHH